MSIDDELRDLLKSFDRPLPEGRVYSVILRELVEQRAYLEGIADYQIQIMVALDMCGSEVIDLSRQKILENGMRGLERIYARLREPAGDKASD